MKKPLLLILLFSLPFAFSCQKDDTPLCESEKFGVVCVTNTSFEAGEVRWDNNVLGTLLPQEEECYKVPSGSHEFSAYFGGVFDGSINVLVNTCDTLDLQI